MKEDELRVLTQEVCEEEKTAETFFGWEKNNEIWLKGGQCCIALVASCCKHSNNPGDSMYCEKCSGQLSDYELLNEYFMGLVIRVFSLLICWLEVWYKFGQNDVTQLFSVVFS